MRQYLTQVRQECAARLVQSVYGADGKPSKWWMSFQVCQTLPWAYFLLSGVSCCTETEVHEQISRRLMVTSSRSTYIHYVLPPPRHFLISLQYFGHSSGIASRTVLMSNYVSRIIARRQGWGSISILQWQRSIVVQRSRSYLCAVLVLGNYEQSPRSATYLPTHSDCLESN